MRFAKLHGAGNDFLLFDGRDDPLLESALPPLVPRLCERRLGVGADGVLLLLPRGEHAARLLYWNRDGSPGAFCANGTRCAARYAAERWGWPAVTIDTVYNPASQAFSVTGAAAGVTQSGLGGGNVRFSTVIDPNEALLLSAGSGSAVADWSIY